MCDEYCGLNCEYRYPNCLSRYYIGNKESVSPGHLPDPNYQPQPSRIYREDLLTEYTTGPNSLICYFHCCTLTSQSHILNLPYINGFEISGTPVLVAVSK